jgi:shikimate kinase
MQKQGEVVAHNRGPNVVLTGFMGTGKSTVGRLLAERLGYDFVDTDEMIVERHGAISEIFASQGEDAFRALEREVAVELSNRQATVVSTGGRLMLDADSAGCLGESGRVFCLVAEVEEIIRRVHGNPGGPERPLLAGPDPRGQIVALLEERASGYGRFEQIGTDGQKPEVVVEEILTRLG